MKRLNFALTIMEEKCKFKTSKCVRRSSWPFDSYNYNDIGDDMFEVITRNDIRMNVNGNNEQNHQQNPKIDIENIRMIFECIVSIHRNDEPCKCPVNCRDDDQCDSQVVSSPEHKSRVRHLRSRSQLQNGDHIYGNNKLTVPVELENRCVTSTDSTISCSSCTGKCNCSSSSSSSGSKGPYEPDSCSSFASSNSHDRQITGNESSPSSSSYNGVQYDGIHYDGIGYGTVSTIETILPDEYILYELAEMRSFLEHILENRDHLEFDTTNTNEILNLFGLSLSDSPLLEPKESSTHFPIGKWEFEECGICLELCWLYRRACCNYSACISCLRQYYSSRVELGSITIECINPFCHGFVHRDEISARLGADMKQVYYRLLMAKNSSDRCKTCPQCNSFLKLNDEQMKTMKVKRGDPSLYRVQCSQCQYYWCFKCHSPWHENMSCKQFRKGDRLLKTWAKETIHGQVNAQRCPTCRIFIQRTSGCDHMHCTRCKTDFCYKCGDKLRRLKFFGDHYSKLSIFGCKYRYKSDKPFQRKLIRGAVFGGKLMLIPALGSLALCAGAIVVTLGIAAFPLYGALKLYRKYQEKRYIKDIRQRQIATFANNNITFNNAHNDEMIMTLR